MRSLNVDQLRALAAVVEQRSFAAAARLLNLSQPAVSLQIRELERRFGVRLIERLGKQAYPTPPGRDLLEVADSIMRECDRAEAVMRRYRDGWIGRVRIGTTNTALQYLLLPVLRKLATDYPGIDLHVTNLPSRESVEAVRDNTIDLAIVTLPVATDRISITPIYQDRMVAIFPAGAKGIPEAASPDSVAGWPCVMEHTRAALCEMVMKWFALHELQPRIVMHLGTLEAIKSAVESHLGMAFVPEMIVHRDEVDVVVRPLRPELSRTLALIEHHSKASDPAYDIVRDALLDLRSRPPDEKQRPRPKGGKLELAAKRSR